MAILLKDGGEFFEISEEVVNVRKEPNINSNIIGMALKGYIVKALKKSDDNNWYYLSSYSGWVMADYLKYTTANKEVINKNSDVYKTVQTVKTENIKLATASAKTSNGGTKFLSNNLSSIFGIPYQFMSTVDRRLDGNMFGRKYAEKIVGRLPLLFIAPGRQEFLQNYSNKQDVVSIINDLVDGNGKMSNADIQSRSGKFYNFARDTKNYFNYVNPMCQVVAQMMGIGSKKITIGNYTSSLRSFNWSRVLNNDFSSYFGLGDNLVYYIDGLNSVSESFSNSTRQSQLAGTINAKEINFLIGEKAQSKAAQAASAAGDATAGQMANLVNSLTGGGGVISNMINQANIDAILEGGKLIFPEMWDDSEYGGGNYSLNIKLRSPDCDSLSLYLNIMVPYIHLLALILPHRMSANAYSSPFLVRACYKGVFNIDMGIITGMSVSKGKEGSWNDQGIPTEMDISIDIKDLYTSLTAGSMSHPAQIVNNTALMDYLSIMSGINLATDEVDRIKTIYNVILHTNKITQTPSNLWNEAMDTITNQFDKLFK